MRLTTLREGLGIGRGAFADSVRIDRSSYTKIEAGKKPLNQDMAYRISLRWGVTMDYLYKGGISDDAVPASAEATVSVVVGIQRLPGRDPALPLPHYVTGGASGMDLCANLAPEQRQGGLAIAPGERALLPSGLAVSIPEGFEVQLRPRSGLALRHGITLVNSPGTVDSDYRGELAVILVNHGAAPFTVEHGMRIAQLVLAPVTRLIWREAPALGETARAAGGFGSTGTGQP